MSASTATCSWRVLRRQPGRRRRPAQCASLRSARASEHVRRVRSRWPIQQSAQSLFGHGAACSSTTVRGGGRRFGRRGRTGCARRRWTGAGTSAPERAWWGRATALAPPVGDENPLSRAGRHDDEAATVESSMKDRAASSAHHTRCCPRRARLRRLNPRCAAMLCARACPSGTKSSRRSVLGQGATGLSRVRACWSRTSTRKRQTRGDEHHHQRRRH